ncbi:MAG TPA: site-specific integrase [Ktedonobacterales bacterium]|nr:site-specific integrase [Ktedonobacterales bacterium]
MPADHDAMDDALVKPKTPDDAGVRALPALPTSQTGRAWGEGSTGESAMRHPWRAELTRWLLTLNPGRTQVEYEKAVRYFFATPGAPADLTDLSYDLLLAYRGALALRAARPQDAPHAVRRASVSPPEARLGAAQHVALPNPDASTNESAAFTQPETPWQAATTPLAPATVNIRLTALRQFLVYASLAEALEPRLTPERIRLALRRLTTERRRPYQALSQQEWPQFLAQAATPAHPTHSPWGVPRAARQPQPADSSPQRTSMTPAAPHSQRTGARTAQRDHALLSLALATGLRAIELSLLDVGDLSCEWHDDQEEWWLILPDAKTKGQRGGRTLPLAPALVETLLDYVQATGRDWGSRGDRRTPLFLAQAHELRRLSPAQIRGIVDRVEQQWIAQRDREAQASEEQGDGAPAGQRQRSKRGRRRAGEARNISPHALRHSAALALLEGDEASGRPPASVEHVRGWLGHFDIRTTQGYLAHLDDRRHRRRFAITPEGQTAQQQEGDQS